MLSRETWMPDKTSKTGLRRVLLCSDDEALATATLGAIANTWILAQETDPNRVLARIAEFAPDVVFVDFQPHPIDDDKLLRAAELVRRIVKSNPTLSLVAVGSQDHPQGPLAALRAGVHDFIDPVAEPEQVLQVAERVLPSVGVQEAGVQRVAVIGVRPGVGCSTLAAHVSDLLRCRFADDSRGLALCDLGWPVGDAQLYLGLKPSEMDFAQAVQNLSRLDQTLIRTAFSSSASGVALVPLPVDLDDMQTITQAGAVGLMQALTSHFGLMIADLGGFPNADFVAQVAANADQTWLVTDQSIGALVSLAQLVRDLDARDVPRGRLKLVVNRYSEDYGMSAGQISARFGVPLLLPIPDRTKALMSASSQGLLLHMASEQDPYVKAVSSLIDMVWQVHAARPSPWRWLQRWMPKERTSSGLVKSKSRA